MDRGNLGRMLFLAIVVAMVAAYFFSPLGEWLTLARLRESRESLVALVEARPALSIACFFLICVAATSLCFPAAPLIGVSAGALFGFWPALATVLTASTIGSTIAFLASRHLLRGWAEAKLGARMEPIDRGFERHGAFYLLTLRFNPLIPYWLVNLAMGLTAMRLKAYVPLTLIGLSPATTIYADAGTQLARIESAADIVSFRLLAALVLLSLFPLIADWAMTRLRRRPA